jgi:hypoxanthine phosphoribosyltransferase
MCVPARQNVSAAGRQVGRVIVPRDRIAARVAELAERITDDYRGWEVTVLAVMNGAAVFLADLIRRIPLPLRIETTTARSYRGTAVRPGGLTMAGLRAEAFAGRHVLIVDDILDTGRTLDRILRRLAEFAPAGAAVCVLLRKDRPGPARPVAPRYVGFDIPDEFVVGYGLDFDDLYRDLPDVCALRPQETTP